jgi:hypothetical protein
MPTAYNYGTYLYYKDVSISFSKLYDLHVKIIHKELIALTPETDCDVRYRLTCHYYTTPYN